MSDLVKQIRTLLEYRCGEARPCIGSDLELLEMAGDEIVRLRGVIREVRDSVPATCDYEDPMVERHAKALNACREASITQGQAISQACEFAALMLKMREAAEAAGGE